MRASNWVSKKIFFITMKLNVWGLVVGGLWGWVDTLNIQKNTSCYSVIVNITQRYHQLAASWLYQQRPTSVKVVCKRPKLCGTFNMHWTHLKIHDRSSPLLSETFPFVFFSRCKNSCDLRVSRHCMGRWDWEIVKATRFPFCRETI